MAENENGRQAQGGPTGWRNGLLGGSKDRIQKQGSKTPQKSTGKEDERGESSSGGDGSNK